MPYLREESRVFAYHAGWNETDHEASGGQVYALLWIRTYHPEVFRHVVQAGNCYTSGWDLPENSRQEIEFMIRTAELFGTARKGGAPKRKTKH